MFRLAHISDPHLGPLPEPTYRELASKRITGYVNWRRNRMRHHREGVVDAVTAAIKTEAPDHLAITGDLVNLALDAEIHKARQWLDDLGEPEGISVVPGNHDAYVPGALDEACRAWAPYMCGDDMRHPVDRDAFPYMRRRGPVCLIGVSSARATAPFMANGFFRADQAKRLAALLRSAGEDGCYRVVMIHHPPLRGIDPVGRLFGIRLFQSVIRDNGAELVLHGHTHLPSLGWIAGHDAPTPVVGVAATGQSPGGRRPAAGFNLFEIVRRKGEWKTTLERHSVAGHVAGTERVSVEMLDPARA
ncbi:MAG: metallophosphoesterase [Phyllobacteriaceae bacterium]|nr:metallophosphoesterase [Phyllobacteriaceae bacterium]